MFDHARAIPLVILVAGAFATHVCDGSVAHGAAHRPSHRPVHRHGTPERPHIATPDVDVSTGVRHKKQQRQTCRLSFRQQCGKSHNGNGTPDLTGLRISCKDWARVNVTRFLGFGYFKLAFAGTFGDDPTTYAIVLPRDYAYNAHRKDCTCDTKAWFGTEQKRGFVEDSEWHGRTTHSNDTKWSTTFYGGCQLAFSPGVSAATRRSLQRGPTPTFAVLELTASFSRVAESELPWCRRLMALHSTFGAIGRLEGQGLTHCDLGKSKQFGFTADGRAVVVDVGHTRRHSHGSAASGTGSCGACTTSCTNNWDDWRFTRTCPREKRKTGNATVGADDPCAVPESHGYRRGGSLIMLIAKLAARDLLGLSAAPHRVTDGTAPSPLTVAAMGRAGPEVEAGARSILHHLETTAATAAEAQQMVLEVLTMASDNQGQQCLDGSVGVFKAVIAKDLAGPRLTQEECLAETKGEVGTSCISGVPVPVQLPNTSSHFRKSDKLSSMEANFVKWVLQEHSK